MGRGILLLFSGRVPSCYSNQDLDCRGLDPSSQRGFHAGGTASYLLLICEAAACGGGAAARSIFRARRFGR